MLPLSLTLGTFSAIAQQKRLYRATSRCTGRLLECGLCAILVRGGAPAVLARVALIVPMHAHACMCEATGLSRGYAFVEFEHETDFVAAFRSAHRQELDGAQVRGGRHPTAYLSIVHSTTLLCSQILVDYERERVMPGTLR